MTRARAAAGIWASVVIGAEARPRAAEGRNDPAGIVVDDVHARIIIGEVT